MEPPAFLATCKDPCRTNWSSSKYTASSTELNAAGQAEPIQPTTQSTLGGWGNSLHSIEECLHPVTLSSETSHSAYIMTVFIQLPSQVLY